MAAGESAPASVGVDFESMRLILECRAAFHLADFRPEVIEARTREQASEWLGGI